MEITASKKILFLVLLFAVVIVRVRSGEQPQNNNVTSSENAHNKTTHNEVAVNNKRSGAGGGGYGWGWGGGGGGGGGRGGAGGGGGGGWGWGGGGGGYWGWGCRNQQAGNRGHHFGKNKEYLMGEFAQCVVRGRCRGMRLDCPLHCGGPCFYDCRHMCKAHCKR